MTDCVTESFFQSKQLHKAPRMCVYLWERVPLLGLIIVKRNRPNI